MVLILLLLSGKRWPSFFSRTMPSRAARSGTLRPSWLRRGRRGPVGRGWPAEFKLGAKNAADFIVDRLFGNLPGFDGGQEFFAIQEFSRPHFQIESAIGRTHRVVGGVPVGHNDSLKA